MAVMKLGCEVEQQLVISIVFDDDTVKNRRIAKGDYISIAYNKNGMRRVSNGIVATIFANPFNPKLSRKDWYLILSADDNAGVVRIAINNILDVEVLKQNQFDATVKTPNDSSRVTNIRIHNNTLQISQDDGESWFNVGANGKLNDDFSSDEQEIVDKLTAMIGSDQYADTDELVKGIAEIINQEVRKRQSKANTNDVLTDRRNVDITPNNSYDEHSGYKKYIGPNISPDGAVNDIHYV